MLDGPISERARPLNGRFRSHRCGWPYAKCREREWRSRDEWTAAVSRLRGQAHGALGLIRFHRDDIAGAVRAAVDPVLHYRFRRLYAITGHTRMRGSTRAGGAQCGHDAAGPGQHRIGRASLYISRGRQKFSKSSHSADLRSHTLVIAALGRPCSPSDLDQPTSAPNASGSYRNVTNGKTVTADGRDRGDGDLHPR